MIACRAHPLPQRKACLGGDPFRRDGVHVVLALLEPNRIRDSPSFRFERQHDDSAAGTFLQDDRSAAVILPCFPPRVAHQVFQVRADRPSLPLCAAAPSASCNQRSPRRTYAQHRLACRTGTACDTRPTASVPTWRPPRARHPGCGLPPPHAILPLEQRPHPTAPLPGRGSSVG